ncbi:sulfotransferase domain-containing protein [Psychromonas sp. PT13]|uniref:sulfotransferase domain-containing protein n=1 Tax=Psychromonas sp. PT13 TaxID=3439547 RepID=UPI003EBE5EFA
MIKESLKQLAKGGKEYLRYLKYKNMLPKNPMHDDIYIVEFPKSGITWLQNIIGNIELQLIDKREKITFYNHHKYLPDIHQVKGININRFLNRSFIKSHSKYNPYYYFVVYLIRNPFDVMVSYYNFLTDHGQNFTFEEFVKSNNGIVAWKNHINSWHYKRLDAQRLHFIKYENLLSNAELEIKKLYENLGVEVLVEVLQKALKYSSLDEMSQLELHYKDSNPNYSMTFVGKKNKKRKEELLTADIKEYITLVAKDEIEYFYPELLKN